MKNTKRKIAIAVAVVAAAVGVHVANVSVTAYGDSSTQNAGVYVEAAGHWCGFEYRGTVGTFCDVN